MKKQGFLRAIALCLLCTFLLCTFCACVEEVGAGHRDRTTVLKIGDYKVTMDQYLYLCYKIRDAYDHGDHTYWNAHPEMEDKFRKDVLKELAAIYAVYSLAEEYDIELSDEDEDRVNMLMRAYIEPYRTEEAFLAVAEKNHMTGDLVRMELEFEILQEKLYAHLSDVRSEVISSTDADIEAAIAQEQYYCVRYILLQHVETDADSIASHKELMEQWRTAVAVGNQIQLIYGVATLAANQAISQSYQLSSGKMETGTYFIKGYQNAMAEEAVLALPNGGVSQVLETDDYLVFYQRFACDLDYMRGEGFADLRNQYIQKKFSEICDLRAQELLGEIKYKGAYEGAFSMTQN